MITWRREELFGRVVNGVMELNPFGRIVEEAWHDLPNHYPIVKLDTFCVMPNHVHGIIVLLDDDMVGVGEGLRPSPTRPSPTTGKMRYPLFEIVRAYKSFSARRINALRETQGISVWQRSYYEHIIRGNDDHLAISNYIRNNPMNWDKDDENPTEIPTRPKTPPAPVIS
jgi:putative transposase